MARLEPGADGAIATRMRCEGSGLSGSMRARGTSTTLTSAQQAFRAALTDIGVADDRVHFELFEAGHMGIDYRYPVSLAWLCSRMSP